MFGVLLALVAALRPKQWTKNLLLFAGVLFSQQLNHPPLVLRSAAGFLAFSLLAGCTYLFNDLRDVESDRLHPRKRKRPIASGRLPVAVAWGALFPLLAVAVALALWLGKGFTIVAAIYIGLNVVYSLGLRNLVLVDVFVIALGFVLRAIAGVELLRELVPETTLSPWLLVCTFFGALFLALGKRRRELANAGDVASNQRRVLERYSPELLDGLLMVTAATSVMGYALYTIWPTTVAKFGTEALMYTIPFVAYGVFRYLYVLRVNENAEDPSLILLTDRPLAGCVLCYLVAVVAILYRV
jgi:4-hydroxybenzoate polyprenyltransferase